MSKPEWSAMETPFAGMTERKQKQAVKFMFIPLCSFSLRRAYDGDVSEDELQSCARTFVAAFEAELGEKIPPAEPKDDLEKMVGSGVPAFGDVRAILQSDKRQAFLFHGFSRSDGLIPEIVELNGFISVGPAVLNDHAVNYRELVKKIPLDRLLVETDAVVGARVPTRPHIRDVLVKTADILNLSAAELEKTTDENADRFLGAV